MEGDCLSCMKYLLFVFNFFLFVSVSAGWAELTAAWKWSHRATSQGGSRGRG